MGLGIFHVLMATLCFGLSTVSAFAAEESYLVKSILNPGRVRFEDDFFGKKVADKVIVSPNGSSGLLVHADSRNLGGAIQQAMNAMGITSSVTWNVPASELQAASAAGRILVTYQV